jgi:anti-anti-sigma factor
MQLAYEADSEIEGALVVRLGGALEVNAAARLWEMASKIAGDDARFFLFDLSDVNIVTSAGIGVLVRLLVRLQGFGGAIAIHGCSDKICEIFTIVQLDKILQVCNTEEEARQKLKSA